jgi:hypothetical protein
MMGNSAQEVYEQIIKLYNEAMCLAAKMFPHDTPYFETTYDEATGMRVVKLKALVHHELTPEEKHAMIEKVHGMSTEGISCEKLQTRFSSDSPNT